MELQGGLEISMSFCRTFFGHGTGHIWGQTPFATVAICAVRGRVFAVIPGLEPSDDRRKPPCRL